MGTLKKEMKNILLMSVFKVGKAKRKFQYDMAVGKDKRKCQHDMTVGIWHP